MEARVSDILHTLIRWAPLDLAESWDNVGLQVGNPNKKINNIFLTLDLTPDSLDNAIKLNSHLIITHHPIIFPQLKAIDLTTTQGRLLKDLIINDISVISMHTNLDKAINGVSDTLVEILDLNDYKPILPSSEDNRTGLGRVGQLTRPMTLIEIVRLLYERLKPNHITYVGDESKVIQKVALCGGSGSDLIPKLPKDVDLFITSEIKHHHALFAKSSNLSLINLSHFHSECLIVNKIKDYLHEQAQLNNWSLNIFINTNENSPFNLYKGEEY